MAAGQLTESRLSRHVALKLSRLFLWIWRWLRAGICVCSITGVMRLCTVVEDLRIAGCGRSLQNWTKTRRLGPDAHLVPGRHLVDETCTYTSTCLLSATMLTLNGLDRHVDPGATVPVRIRAHSAADLASICIDYLSLPYAQWTAARKQALIDFDQWQNNWNAKCTMPFTIPDPGPPASPYPAQFNVPTVNDMTILIDIISQLFLGGLLDVDFSWHVNLCSNPNGIVRPINSRIGETNVLDEDDLTGRVTLWLDPAPHAFHEDKDHRLRVVDTLLHECVHAFLGTYACQSDTCPCIRQSNLDLGLTGHGASWVQLSTHVMAFWRTHSTVTPVGNLQDVLKDVRKEFATSSHVLTPREIQLCTTDFSGSLTRFRARALDVNRHITWRTTQKAVQKIAPNLKHNSKFLRYPSRKYTTRLAELMVAGVQKRPNSVQHLRKFKKCRAAAVADFAKWNAPVKEAELEWPDGFKRAA